METIGKPAKLSANKLQTATNASKNQALLAIYRGLEQERENILAANAKDLSENKGNISEALYNRLDLSGKYQDLLQGVQDVVKLEDPTNKTTLARELDDGLELYRVSCPVGVLLIIFEARPEVVVQISCLAIKSGNAVILKGGKEAFHSNVALFNVIRTALEKENIASVPGESVSLVSTRDEIAGLLKCNEWIDLVIPRGSKQLVRHIQQSTTIPVLGHADGLCSIFVDADADLEKAVKIVVDAKTHYPSACNAAEKLLIHKLAAPRVLPVIAEALLKVGVIIHADSESISLLPKSENIREATSEAFVTEFLSLQIAVKIIDSLDDAISHINEFGSHHTDCIITETTAHADEFMKRVDSAGVYHNASTRFADGFRYGFGAEIGVSTNKTHARGPVGLEGLVIYKYRLYGNGHCAAMYGNGKRAYKHLDINPKSFE